MEFNFCVKNVMKNKKSKKKSKTPKVVGRDQIESRSKTEWYREEYPGASDTDIEIIRWALHDEED